MPFEAAYADLLLGLGAASSGERVTALDQAAHAMHRLGASFDEQAVLALSSGNEAPRGSICALVKPLASGGLEHARTPGPRNLNL
jgi:hypothetical protein